MNALAPANFNLNQNWFEMDLEADEIDDNSLVQVLGHNIEEANENLPQKCCHTDHYNQQHQCIKCS